MKAYEECIGATSTGRRLGMLFRRRQRERSVDRISIILDTLEGLEMSYPKTTDERRQELLEIRKQLTN